MLTIITEVKLWSMHDDIIIKDTDFSAFRYHDKKDSTSSSSSSPTDIFANGKKDYAEKRNGKWILDNKRPGRLRDSLRRLDECLKQHKIVYCKWNDATTIQMILSNGLFLTVTIDPISGDVRRIHFDKYLMGKLINEKMVTDAMVTRVHIILAYNQNQLTLVYLQKPMTVAAATAKATAGDGGGNNIGDSCRANIEKISDMDPKIYNVLINGPQNRPISRQLTCNSRADLIAVWTKSSKNEVYPWRPTIRDQDRANVHIYKLNRIKLEAVCYYWTENDPICVEFSNIHPNQLHSVEQKISRKGVIIEVCIYQVKKQRLHRLASTVIPLQTQVCCHSFSPDNERLMLGCIDGSLVIFDESRGITHLVKAAFIPTLVSWHCDSAILCIANDRCQLQCFDISLACIKIQSIADDTLPGNLFDLSINYNVMAQPRLNNLWWNVRYDPLYSANGWTPSDSFLLLYYENGPLACVRFVCGANFRADCLIERYIGLNAIEKAINLLLCLNWNICGEMCLNGLNQISNFILIQDLSEERALQLEKALSSFHVPVKPLCPDTEDEFADDVRQITRRFFFFLLYLGSYEKAFSLAIDINDKDLFVDLHQWAELDGEIELARDASEKAEEIWIKRFEEDGESESICSNSSCSECAEFTTSESDEDSGGEQSVNEEEAKEEENVTKKSSEIDDRSNRLYQTSSPTTSSRSTSTLPMVESAQPTTSRVTFSDEHPPLSHRYSNTKPDRYLKKSYVPPLPHLNQSSSSHVRFNIPKPELKVSTYSKNQYRNIGRSSRIPSSTAIKTIGIVGATSIAATPTTTITNHPVSYSSANFTPDNILLLDPLPYSNCHSNIAHGYPDFIPDIHNSFSTERVKKFDLDDPSMVTAERLSLFIHSIETNKKRKAPKALPRSGLIGQAITQQQHTVIDVVPKPQQTDWQIPDQTLGIPLTYSHNIQQSPRLTKDTSSSASLYLYSSRPVAANYLAENPATTTAITNENLNPLLSIPSILIKEPSSSGIISGPMLSSPPSSSSSLSPSLQIPTSAPFAITPQTSSKRESGERNKVKFSDKIVVAEIPRKEKSLIDRIKRPSGFSSMVTDPKKELADSLPLCSPNDEYLKDFQPINLAQEEDKMGKKKTKPIKVVHFGVV